MAKKRKDSYHVDNKDNLVHVNEAEQVDFTLDPIEFMEYCDKQEEKVIKAMKTPELSRFFPPEFIKEKEDELEKNKAEVARMKEERIIK